MDREIIFRGKRVDNDEWIYGSVIARHGGTYIVDANSRTALQRCTTYNSEFDWRSIEVKPKTVGQYTGLTDKNGKKIFEGDILRGFNYPFRYGEGNHNYYSEVVWFKNSSAFGLVTHKNPKSDVVGISEGNCEYMEDWEAFLWEVIGNIYDNKELLND